MVVVVVAAVVLVVVVVVVVTCVLSDMDSGGFAVFGSSGGQK